MTPPRYQCLSHCLFSHIDYPVRPLGDVVSNLVSSNIKSLQCLPRSLLSFSLLAMLLLVYAATGTALSLAHIYTELVEPRLLYAETVVLNRRTFLISCWTALYLTLWPSSVTLSLFWTSGPIRGEFPDYWDSMELVHAPIPRNGSGKPTTTTKPALFLRSGLK